MTKALAIAIGLAVGFILFVLVLATISRANGADVPPPADEADD